MRLNDNRLNLNRLNIIKVTVVLEVHEDIQFEIRINHALQVGDRIELNSENRTITLIRSNGDVENIRHTLTTDDWLQVNRESKHIETIVTDNTDLILTVSHETRWK